MVLTVQRARGMAAEEGWKKYSPEVTWAPAPDPQGHIPLGKDTKEKCTRGPG